MDIWVVLIYVAIALGILGWGLGFAYLARYGKRRLAYSATALWFVLLVLAVYGYSVETYDIAKFAALFIAAVHLVYGLSAAIGWGLGKKWRKKALS
ncbi:hypothetical protein [Ruegeria sp. HKCCD8929]|uniref:hypothetical protein n=1 Tax=Ruegeria sp. HKCCD8929 TaxID=2683006 RepID=UPI001487B7AE|nr:hypothetical protein [Ruegeria sp. HKCCD8929]